ncbi:MAG: carboxypeptidase-like regulatory domain-containing protein [Nonlabens sp.]|uniref:carboxypeptidase-like regulatory domain-containing protein n=1 Tax=Nonlabens sp. TaxID=1888209 RepID=UPI003EF159CD
MKKLLLLGFIMLMAFVSQAKTITGKVVDETNTPLLGVTIFNNTSKKSTSTGFDGLYSIEAKRNEILTFHVTNYQPIHIKVGKSVLNISMKPEIQQSFISCYRVMPKIESHGTITDTIQKNKKSIAEILKTQIPHGYVTNRDTIRTKTKDIPFKERLYLINGQATKLQDSGILDTQELERIQFVKEKIEPLFIINGKLATVKEFRAINPRNLESLTIIRPAGELILHNNRNLDRIIVIETIDK